MPDAKKPNTGRKLFFGLFVFPLLIAIGMAVFLCSVVLLTSEKETPESLVAAIKTGSPSKRWQKAFELSNELNLGRRGELRSRGVMREIIHILNDPARYDEKTRGYMAIALSHFPMEADPSSTGKANEAVESLRLALKDPSADVKVYALWSLGVLGAREALPEVMPFLADSNDELRRVSAYVLGVIGDAGVIAPLKALLDDPTADVRWNAALALARLKDLSGTGVLYQMLERDALVKSYGLDEGQIEAVMINAAKGLALVGDKRLPAGRQALEALRKVSQNDKNLKVRQAAINAVDLIIGKNI